MIRGFIEGYRRARDEAIADYIGHPPEGRPPEDYPDAAPDDAAAEQRRLRIEELEAALRASHAKGDEQRQILDELADRLENQHAQIGELEATLALLAGALRLPDVETWLRTRFHPDKYPNASTDQAQRLLEATQTINAAYAAIKQRRAVPT